MSSPEEMEWLDTGAVVIIHAQGSPLDGKRGAFTGEVIPSRRRKDGTAHYGVEVDGTVIYWLARELEVVK